MRYTVQITQKVIKSIEGIDTRYKKKIIERIDLIEIDPRHNGSEKLSGKDNTYKTRVGKYRIVYEIYDKKVLIVIVRVDHRKQVYL